MTRLKGLISTGTRILAFASSLLVANPQLLEFSHNVFRSCHCLSPTRGITLQRKSIAPNHTEEFAGYFLKFFNFTNHIRCSTLSSSISKLISTDEQPLELSHFVSGYRPFASPTISYALIKFNFAPGDHQPMPISSTPANNPKGQHNRMTID